MPIARPYRRTCRQFKDGTYGDLGKQMYIQHASFAKDLEHYVRAFLLIQKDLLEIFEYVEPAERNLPTYSFRTHALHMRVCIEAEANCTAILAENGYTRSGNWKMRDDYRKIEASHRLSAYEVMYPVWTGNGATRRPFSAWSAGNPLTWYQAYNEAKHDRHDKFPLANFENLTESVAGLAVLLSAQFLTHDFSPHAPGLALSGYGGPPAGYDNAIGGYFLVKFPDNLPAADRYDFDWDTLKTQADPFDNFPFP